MAKVESHSAVPNRQQGAIILVTVVLLLVMISLVTLHTGRIQSFEHKIILNGQNQKQAFAAANAALNQGLAELLANKSWPQGTVIGQLPNQQVFSITATERQITRNSLPLSVFELTATGSSVDQLSKVALTEQAIVYPLLVNIPVAPLMNDGGLDNRATFELIANPNGAGQGVALSVWTNGGVDMSQLNGVSCGLYEYIHQQCQSKAYSQLGLAGADILANDLDFPADVFAHLFNLPLTHYTALRDEADFLLADCSALAQANGLIWVNGDCDIAANVQVGSVLTPVILIIEDGNLSLQNGASITGLVFVLQIPSSVISHDVFMASSCLLSGALVANQKLGRNGGKFKVLYEHNVLELLRSDLLFSRVAKVPGSWQDF